MKKYRVTVNGTVYEVELEELTGSVPVSAHLPRLPHRLPVSRSAPPCPATFWLLMSPPGKP